jgi:hypothetical protein
MFATNAPHDMCLFLPRVNVSHATTRAVDNCVLGLRLGTVWVNALWDLRSLMEDALTPTNALLTRVTKILTVTTPTAVFCVRLARMYAMDAQVQWTRSAFDVRLGLPIQAMAAAPSLSPWQNRLDWQIQSR